MLMLDIMVTFFTTCIILAILGFVLHKIIVKNKINRKQFLFMIFVQSFVITALLTWVL